MSGPRRDLILHAGLVACCHRGRWRGVLIQGPSGSGKSDLALRLLERGFQLVADDRTLIWPGDGHLWGRAPDPLSGLIEVRGVGITPRTARPFCRIDLVLSCRQAAQLIERLPDSPTTLLLGIPVPQMDVWPFEPSCAIKIASMMSDLGGMRQ